MANPTDDDRALARCYLSWPDAADRLAHTFAVIREEGQQASAAAIAAEIERRRAAEALAERMWPIVETVGRWMPAPAQVTHIMQWVPSAMCEAAAALVRERENG